MEIEIQWQEHELGSYPTFDPDEPPPDPLETLNALEHQRYISKLIHWGLEASEREQSQPHLVERDNDLEGGS